MKKPQLILGLFITLILSEMSPVAVFGQEGKMNPEGLQENQNATDKVESAVIDSARTLLETGASEAIKPGAKPELKQTEIQRSTENLPQTEDQNNSPVSSFNFLYYLIEKFKFPDLLDDSFNN